jgi:hypothetical protein
MNVTVDWFGDELRATFSANGTERTYRKPDIGKWTECDPESGAESAIENRWILSALLAIEACIKETVNAE